MKFYEDVRDQLGKRATGFDFIFNYLKDIHNPFIVETGCARQENNYEGDGLSTLLFDKYINEYGGYLAAVDISPVSVQFALSHMVCPRTKIVQSDSVDFLKILNADLQHDRVKIDFLYLDSFDWTEQLQVESATHHLKELKAIMHSLKSGALIGVDDNWKIGNTRVGKGWMVLDYLASLGMQPVFDEYQIFWIYK